MSTVNKGIRVINFLIDVMIIGIITGILIHIFRISIDFNILLYTCYFVYYVVLESINGQTIAKLITRTMVVSIDNTKASVFKIIMRTILRLYPFDSMSYLFGFENGAHDMFSKTKLITKDRQQNTQPSQLTKKQPLKEKHPIASLIMRLYKRGR